MGLLAALLSQEIMPDFLQYVVCSLVYVVDFLFYNHCIILAIWLQVPAKEWRKSVVTFHKHGCSLKWKKHEWKFSLISGVSLFLCFLEVFFSSDIKAKNLVYVFEQSFNLWLFTMCVHTSHNGGIILEFVSNVWNLS